MSCPTAKEESFKDSLRAHLEEWRFGVDGSRCWMWPVWTDGIYEDNRRLAGISEAMVRSTR